MDIGLRALYARQTDRIVLGPREQNTFLSTHAISETSLSGQSTGMLRSRD